MAGKVYFEEYRCKGCGVCVMVCPKKILSLDEEKTNDNGYHPARIDDESKCIACAACAKMCPDSVIKVEKV